MALKEIPLNQTGNEQLSFSAFRLADLVAENFRLQYEKKEAMDDFNLRLKALNKEISKLSAEIQSERSKA